MASRILMGTIPPDPSGHGKGGGGCFTGKDASGSALSRQGGVLPAFSRPTLVPCRFGRTFVGCYHAEAHQWVAASSTIVRAIVLATLLPVVWRLPLALWSPPGSLTVLILAIALMRWPRASASLGPLEHRACRLTDGPGSEIPPGRWICLTACKLALDYVLGKTSALQVCR